MASSHLKPGASARLRPLKQLDEKGQGQQKNYGWKFKDSST